MGMRARVLHVAYNEDRDARDDCDAHARDDRYAGLPRGSGAAKAARLVKRWRYTMGMRLRAASAK